MCCHPPLPPDARVALSLKTVGGFSVAEIARAFLSSEATIAQRLVRAKRPLREHADRHRPAARLGPDGAARFGPRGDLSPLQRRVQRARGRRARPAGSLPRSAAPRRGWSPDSPRRRVAGGARAGGAHGVPGGTSAGAAWTSAGEIVLLEDQDRALWDRTAGRARLRALRAQRRGTAHDRLSPAGGDCRGPRRRARAGTDTLARILALYDDLLTLQPSPVVALNRAVALARGRGTAQTALAAIEPSSRTSRRSRITICCRRSKARLLSELGDHPPRPPTAIARRSSVPAANPSAGFSSRAPAPARRRLTSSSLLARANAD